MPSGGLLGDNIGLKEEVIKKACSASFKADKSQDKTYYVVEKIRGGSSEPVNIIAFPATWGVTDFFVNKPCRETEINVADFPSLRSVGNDEAALVNEAFLGRIESILKSSPLKSEVNKAITEGKQIVFTGHASGAAVAIFATFWALEEYHIQIKNKIHKPIFCVTFGSPLVGNHILSHATKREKWSNHFIHFVMRFDIVPRILLAPFPSIEQTFSTVLQLFSPKTKQTTFDPTKAGAASDFYSAVMRNAATVTSHAACILMGSTNLLLETVTNFVDLSPYRPFGTFIFCTGNGQLIVVQNSDAVLQLLFHTAQPHDLSDVSEVAKKSILQHMNYEAELQDSLGMQNVVYLDQPDNLLDKIPLSADGSNSDVSRALDEIGLFQNTRARLCLRAAGELQKQKQKNEKKIDEEVVKVEKRMKELEDYKGSCEVQKGYYDAFKLQKDPKDFQANVSRLVLAGVWDELIEMLKRYELPEELEGNQKWIEHGKSFRRLVEPLDIANYYRHLKNEDTGPYMIKARPKRYRYTQRWSEHDKRAQKGAISESSFWAEVEELWSWTNNNKAFEDVKDKVIQLEKNIEEWHRNGDITNDVFLKESTFVKWWETLPRDHKETSCIKNLIV